MKEKAPVIPPLKAWPRLVVEPKEASPQEEVGFLQLNSNSEKIEVGAALGREFRLVQCLFSPQNFVSAKFSPVTQTYERVFMAIRIQGDTTNERLLNDKSVENEMTTIVQKSMRTIQRGAVGKHVSFVEVGDKIRMEIAGAF